MAHSNVAHGKHKAMAQFNEGHHEKNVPASEVADGKYSVEMNDASTGKEHVDGLASYVKKHRMKH